MHITAEKKHNLDSVIKNHDFTLYFKFTATYRAFEPYNLETKVKTSLLQKLSTANWREVPSFMVFWEWFRKKHGMEVAEFFCNHLFPGTQSCSVYMKNAMRNNKNHDLWNHIKARVYKTWCSIVTEMQVVYAIAKSAPEWKVFASPELDEAGIDLIVVADKAYPIQIKKDSMFTPKHKQNNSENLERFSLNKKSNKTVENELKKYKLNVDIDSALLLKYGLPKNNQPAYNYLDSYDNGFVYFKSNELVQTLKSLFG